MRRNLFVILILSAFVFQTAAFAQTAAVKITPAEKKIAEAITAA